MTPVEPTPYYIRIASQSLSGLILALILFAVFVYNRQLNIAIASSLCCYLFYAIRSAIRTKYNLLEYKIDGEQIFLIYQDFDTIKSAEINERDLELKWSSLWERSQNKWKLTFYSRGEQIVYQTTTGDWSFQKLRTFVQDLYSSIKKEPSLNTRMTLDWWDKKVH